MAISFSSCVRKRAFMGESGSQMYTTAENTTTRCVSITSIHEINGLTCEQTAEEEDDLVWVECVRHNAGQSVAQQTSKLYDQS
jgi:hypothetical protein